MGDGVRQMRTADRRGAMCEAWTLSCWLTVTAALILTILQPQYVFARLGINSAKPWAKDAALELNFHSFNSSLWAAPTTTAIVEFYAHWCPACQNFKPHYERVAQLFNGRDAPYPDVMLMAKVDCAESINLNLCQRFHVKHYPTMLWGKPATFAWGSRLSGQDSGLEQISSVTTAQSLLEWINIKLSRSYVLDAAKEKQQSVEVLSSATWQVASILDIEEATDESYDIILDRELENSIHRAPFLQFLQLLAAHHPSRRCRAGSAQVLFNLMDLWPVEHVREDGNTIEQKDEPKAAVRDVKALKQFHICGEDLSNRTYRSCSMGTGGYSCGLWYLFHALSVRVDDLESGTAVRTICEFVKTFFICEECREHFLRLGESAIETVSTRRALVLWLWRAHNEVNRRLAMEAAKGTLELSAPKVQWPTRQMCTSCRTVSEKLHGDADEEIQWDEDKVYQFLMKAYGSSLEAASNKAQTGITRQQDEDGIGVDDVTTSSSITVPVGAALGIAMASCGFGIAACCWRVQQKKRKYCFSLLLGTIWNFIGY